MKTSPVSTYKIGGNRMPKYNTLKEYLETFNEEAKSCYTELKMIMEEVNLKVKERLFAGQVAFYVEENLKSTFHSSPVIVMSFYTDHVNVFANAVKAYQSSLQDYKFTKKGTMQIYYHHVLHKNTLLKLFTESLQ